MTIRPATLADLPYLLAVERECPGASHWSEEQYRQVLSPGANRLLLVALRASSGNSMEVDGFLVARHLAPEWELENIAVAPDARRSGLGTQLLSELLTRAKETNSESLFLEVRESNAAARALYEKAGFRQIGRRKAYYCDPAEDAILYNLTFSL